MKPPVSYQKKRGGYYTPKPIADFLSAWAIRSTHDEVLEPSCGDGMILASTAEVLLRKGADRKDTVERIHGVEIDNNELKKAQTRLRDLGLPVTNDTIYNGDFFLYCWTQLAPERTLFSPPGENGRFFDVIIGNPPFIRYQHFEEEHRKIAFDLMKRVNLNPSRLTNAWVPFIVAAAMLLKDSGRLAMVVPAELLQVGYTAELRLFLSNTFKKISIFTFRQLIFPDIQQEVVLLCAEKNGAGREGINVVELNGVEDLALHEHDSLKPTTFKPVDHSTEKWTQYYLTVKEIKLIRKLRNDERLQALGKLASVDVGIVTGMNDFFVLTEEAKKRASLNGFTLQIVTRSAHLGGLVFRESNWKNLSHEQLPAYLLNLPNIPLDELPNEARSYVKTGEENGSNSGYKCRIRKRWYIVPSMWTPDAFMLRQIHRYPKIVLNRSGATCTDTIHRVRFHNGIKGEQVTSAFMNSLTFAFAEIVGRSYGGGVLELEPREAELLPVPYDVAKSLDVREIDKLLLSENIESVLDITDKTLLQKALGLSKDEIVLLRRIWKKLYERRIGRR
ncbi:MAG: SAM-dependent methyltransferase [Nitrospirae bacterium CG_4_9_14_3_um_filter_53_35]|nr:MAG: SAM-dependent methyltransferase [Nitrospirae bacterium CG_4_9_14_3_um_filter_53_35]